jgi:hypothetical protein
MKETRVSQPAHLWTQEIASSFDPKSQAVVAPGDCLKSLAKGPDGFAKLIITSPPYNIGKVYEKATTLRSYLAAIEKTIHPRQFPIELVERSLSAN